jgi:hypothetical protein
MHRNQKIHARLQLIKRLLNLPNCEQLIKQIFQNDNQQQGSLTSTQKLKTYLNLLIEQEQNNDLKGQLSANDREILDHLNELLINTNNICTQGTNDILEKFDKAFDDELLKIFSKANKLVKTFLKQFDALSLSLTNDVRILNDNSFSTYAKVRKFYLQTIRTKRIKMYGTKQKWLQMAENLTHEHCLWYNGACAPQFYMLDQTEGPNRERRRLIKSNLNIPHKFFKKEVLYKLDNEKNRGSFDYLMCDEDGLLKNNSDNSYSIGDAISYNLRNSEHIQ